MKFNKELLIIVFIASLLGSIYTKTISHSRRLKSNLALKNPAAVAILADPKKFASAAEIFVRTLGSAVEIVPKAINALKSARELISSTTTTKAIIINLSKREHTWYTYNDAALFKLNTQFQSYMGAYTTVVVHTLGWGAMSTFKDNKNPPYTVERGKVYAFDGRNLSIFMEIPKTKARRFK